MSRVMKRSSAIIMAIVLVAGAVVTAMPVKAEAAAQNSYSDDLWLMARVIYAEAAGEPYEGKVAVGAVIMNRVYSGVFPSTVGGVVYEPWQFSCVGNWMFNSAPDQESINAAIDAMNGWDPTGGALYYFNYHTVYNTWLWSKPWAATIGNHYFTY